MTEQFSLLNSPNDSPRDGTIHEIAQRQLAYWQEIAARWDIYESTKDKRKCIRCKRCRQSIYFLADSGGNPYVYTPQMRQALLVGHIRQNHAEDHK